MMHRLFALAALGTALALTGCKSTPDAGALQSENEALRQQLKEKADALEACDRDRQAAASAKPADKAASGETGFENVGEGVTASRIGNEVHVNIESDVLFDSGKASLKDSAKKSLSKIVDVLKKQYAGKPIRVAGFTDTDPIKHSSFKSNYHLGFERAFSVREYLVGKGLESKMVSLSSFGPDVPMKTKEKSRRVEVIVVN